MPQPDNFALLRTIPRVPGLSSEAADEIVSHILDLPGPRDHMSVPAD